MNREIENDAMLPEYDFSGGMRGKHYQAYRRGTPPVPSKGIPGNGGSGVDAEQAPRIIKEHRSGVAAARPPETALRSENEKTGRPPAGARRSQRSDKQPQLQSRGSGRTRPES